MSPKWRWYLPGYIMALPHTLVGLVLALFYGARNFRWSSGCLECDAPRNRIVGRPFAQTHGWLIVYASEVLNERTWAGLRWLRQHERAHVVQGFLLGPLFPVLYGTEFLIRLALNREGGWRLAYLKLSWERHARSVEDEPGAWY